MEASINWIGPVLMVDHDEVDDIAGAADMAASATQLITAGIASGKIVVPAGVPAALFVQVVSLYFRFESWLIKQVDFGFGVFLTVPWLAIYLDQWWCIIPTSRPRTGPVPIEENSTNTVVGQPQPVVPATWSEGTTGILTTEDEVDLIQYKIDRGAIGTEAVEFVLKLGEGVTWKKALNMPDGAGSSWDIVAEGKDAEQRNGLWAGEEDRGQSLIFSKAKAGGFMWNVLTLGDIGGLNGGDRVTFTWTKDSGDLIQTVF